MNRAERERLKRRAEEIRLEKTYLLVQCVKCDHVETVQEDSRLRKCVKCGDYNLESLQRTDWEGIVMRTWGNDVPTGCVSEQAHARGKNESHEA